jgi:hypothetical protein
MRRCTIAEDVADNKVSVEAARADHGLVTNPE